MSLNTETTIEVLNSEKKKKSYYAFVFSWRFALGSSGCGAQVGLEKTVALTASHSSSSSRMARQQENTLGFKSTQSILGN